MKNLPYFNETDFKKAIEGVIGFFADEIFEEMPRHCDFDWCEAIELAKEKFAGLAPSQQWDYIECMDFNDQEYLNEDELLDALDLMDEHVRSITWKTFNPKAA